MKSFNKFFVLCLMLMISAVAYSDGVHSNDAFVLVDVSGTMKDTRTNNEAMDIIQEILLGNFDISRWKELKWEKVYDTDNIPPAILKKGSRFCLIPFGNMDRVMDYKKCTFEDPRTFNTFYRNNFPTRFNDSWTYLTLAEAFVGSVAITENIKKAYVLIYSDGRPESTKEPLKDYFQQIVWDKQHVGKNSYDSSVCILTKKTNDRIHYDIIIYKFTSYKTRDVNNRDVDDFVPPQGNTHTQTIRITEPKDGKVKTNPHKVSKNKECVLRWSGGAGNVIVYKKEGGAYKRISPNKSKEIYSKLVSGTTAKLTFYNSADYKIEVRGVKGGMDSIFLRITTPVAPMLLWLLLIAGIIAGIMYSYKKISGNGSKHNYDNPEKEKSTFKKNSTDYKNLYE